MHVTTAILKKPSLFVSRPLRFCIPHVFVYSLFIFSLSLILSSRYYERFVYTNPSFSFSCNCQRFHFKAIIRVLCLFLQLLHLIFLANCFIFLFLQLPRFHFKAIIRAFELVSFLFWWIQLFKKLCGMKFFLSYFVRL